MTEAHISTERRSSLLQQVAIARKAIKQWPKWMRETCRMEGTNTKERRL